MKRVYTDERFPGCRIINDGTEVFRVYYRNKLLQSFETYEDPGSVQTDNEKISEIFAERRARDYFDRWHKMEHDQPGDLIQHTVALPPEGTEVEPPADVTQTIDDLMAKLKMERSPTRQKALKRQIMYLMQQEGSVAVAVVNDLIAG